MTRCDSCGAYLVAMPAAESRGAESRAAAPRPSAPSRAERGRHSRGHSQPQGGHGRGSQGAKRNGDTSVPGIAWLLLAVGLAVGGMIGYTLHGSIGPRAEEGGMPSGPADLMSGGGMGGPGGASPGGPMPADMMKIVQSYRAALAKNPDDVEAHIGLGNLDFDSSQWDKAIEHYTKALSLDPKNPDVRVDRAIAYHNLGQDEQAFSEMQAVTKSHPTHKNSWLNLGVVAAGMGNRKVAIQAYERFLELEPNGERSDGVRKDLADMKK
jgi:hypothetical protein